MKAKVLGYENSMIKAVALQEDKCQGCSHCGSKVEGKIIYVKSDKFEPINSIIEIEMDTKYLILAAFLMFGVPVILLILGISLIEDIGVYISFLTIAIYYFIIHRLNSYFFKTCKFMAHVLKEN